VRGGPEFRKGIEKPAFRWKLWDRPPITCVGAGKPSPIGEGASGAEWERLLNFGIARKRA
jgi:hypothetical protein